jgi:hypothetical protein
MMEREREKSEEGRMGEGWKKKGSCYLQLTSNARVAEERNKGTSKNNKKTKRIMREQARKKIKKKDKRRKKIKEGKKKIKEGKDKRRKKR